MQVIVRPLAEVDIAEVALWYESTRVGLGDEFLKTVRSALATLGTNPTLHRVIWRNTRRIVLRRFPYCVYYRIVEDRAVVLACLHGHRNPNAWKSRI